LKRVSNKTAQSITNNHRRKVNEETDALNMHRYQILSAQMRKRT